MPIILYQDVNFGGWSDIVNDGQNIPVLPPPYDNNASSMKVDIPYWVTLWESPNYNQSDDQFWIETAGPGYHWEFPNLHTTWRPHGSNHWGDLISAVSFSGAPTGDTDNQIILYSDGHWGGNLGLLGYLEEDLARGALLRSLFKRVEGPMHNHKGTPVVQKQIPRRRVLTL